MRPLCYTSVVARQQICAVHACIHAVCFGMQHLKKMLVIYAGEAAEQAM